MDSQVEAIIAQTLEAMGVIEEEVEKMDVSITKSDDDERLVYGVVMEPMTDVTPSGDAHGDVISADEIKKSAHAYMRNARVMKRQHVPGVKRPWEPKSQCFENSHFP